MSEHHAENVPVIIVGGGPIGLSMGLLMGRFGINAILLERNAATTDHPKARGSFARTMELFRLWGVEQPVGLLPAGAQVQRGAVLLQGVGAVFQRPQQ